MVGDAILVDLYSIIDMHIDKGSREGLELQHIF